MTQVNDKQAARLERFSDGCPECGGLGTITRYYGGGEFISTIDCDRCLGRGMIGNCAGCGGTGVKQQAACPDCGGAGTIGDCAHCGGSGVMIREGADSLPAAECPHCNGYGFTR